MTLTTQRLKNAKKTLPLDLLVDQTAYQVGSGAQIRQKRVELRISARLTEDYVGTRWYLPKLHA